MGTRPQRHETYVSEWKKSISQIEINVGKAMDM